MTTEWNPQVNEYPSPRSFRRMEGLYPVKGSTKLYEGSLICLDANGYAVEANDTANYKFVGVAMETVNNTGADGAALIRVLKEGIFKFKTSGTFTDPTHLATKVRPTGTGDTVAQGAGTNVSVGYIVDIVTEAGTTYVWVNINQFVQ